MKPVLFICVHNSGRSQMAEGFFNHLARGQVQAISAGTMPTDRVQPEAVQAMAEVGIDISRQRPKLLTVEALLAKVRKEADRGGELNTTFPVHAGRHC